MVEPVAAAGDADARAPRVLVVSGSVGAGHDGAARELAARLQDAGAVVEVRDFLAAVPRPISWLLRDGYLSTVERIPAAFEFLYQRLEHKGAFWRAEATIVGRGADGVARWVADFGPDIVVAMYPPAVQAVGMMRGTGRLTVPAMSYLTDPAAHVSWLHPALDVHATVTEATARQAAADYGVDLHGGRAAGSGALLGPAGSGAAGRSARGAGPAERFPGRAAGRRLPGLGAVAPTARADHRLGRDRAGALCAQRTVAPSPRAGAGRAGPGLAHRRPRTDARGRRPGAERRWPSRPRRSRRRTRSPRSSAPLPLACDHT